MEGGDRFRWPFSIGSSDEVEVRVVRADFEGYSQQGPDGINNLDQKFDIQCESLTREEYADIVSFLRIYARQRQPFQIWDPDDQEWVWVDVDGWGRDFSDPVARNLKISLARSTGV